MLSTGLPIRNIVFDFGGVLLDIDYQLTYNEMGRLLGIGNIPSAFPKEVNDILTRFEKGETGTETFLWSLQKLSGAQIPQGNDLVRAWNAMLLGWDSTKFLLLEELRLKYNLYLLSNTNALHLQWVIEDLKTKHGIRDFEQRFFEKAYFSHELGMRKPDSEIYQFVTQDSAIIPEETLFIDDLMENVKAASQLGWNVYQHDPNENLEKILRSKLKLL